MTQQDNAFYTDGSYLEKNPTWDEEDSPWKADQVHKILSANNIHPDTVCEVGCGAGEILNRLYEMLPPRTEFSGFEISPQAYELASKKEKDRLSFQLEDILQKDVHYDVLLVMDVIEHVEDLFGFTRGLKDKAKYKVFHIPLDISAQRVMQKDSFLNRRNQVGHLHYFTKETALATLADTGYKIIDHFYTNEALERPKQSVKYWLGRNLLRAAKAVNEDFAVRLLGGHSLLVLAK